MQSRSLSRELALLMLGQISDRAESAGRPNPEPDVSMETLLQQALASLSQHVREALDRSAADLQTAQQQLLDSELQDQGSEQLPRVRQHLQDGLTAAEQALNRLSASLELPRPAAAGRPGGGAPWGHRAGPGRAERSTGH